MKIVFISNFYNHHQKYLSDALNKNCNQYIFYETTEINDERIRLGWKNGEHIDYVKNISDENSKVNIESSDFVIIGSAPNSLIEERMKANKLIFRYSERPLKNGNESIKYLPRYIKWHKQNHSENIYMLCASAYTSLDYSKFGLFKNKCYKWGYFPETKKYTYLDDLLENKQTNELLWCGRFIDWKHPDDAIEVAYSLKQLGYHFHLTMIGEGEMKQTLIDLINKRELNEYVSILNPMSPEKIREYMEKTGIYLFTSDRQEGWGAVVNEAMNSGCSVIASHLAGSVPYLIEDKVNGYIYFSGNRKQLLNQVIYLLDHPDEQKKIGKNAYHTIVDLWNGEVAAERLVKLSKHILSGEESPQLYKTGPCSPAEIIKESWYKD